MSYNSIDICNLEILAEDKYTKIFLFDLIDEIFRNILWEFKIVRHSFWAFYRSEEILEEMIVSFLKLLFEKNIKEKLNFNFKKKIKNVNSPKIPSLYKDSIKTIRINYLSKIVRNSENIIYKDKEFTLYMEKRLLRNILINSDYFYEEKNIDIINIILERIKLVLDKKRIRFALDDTKTCLLEIISFLPKYLQYFHIRDLIYIFALLNQIGSILNIPEKTIKDNIETNDYLEKYFDLLLVSEYKPVKQTDINISQFQFEDRDILKTKIDLLKLEENNNLIISLILILRMKVNINDINEKIKLFYNPEEKLSKELDILKNFDNYYEMILNIEAISKFYSVSTGELKKDIEKLKFCFNNNIPRNFILDIFSKIEKLKKIYTKDFIYLSDLIEIYNLIKDSTKDNIQEIFEFEEEIENPDEIIDNLIKMKEFYNEIKNSEKKSLEEIIDIINLKTENDNEFSKILEELYNQKNIIKDLFYKQYNQANYIFFQTKKIMKESIISIKILDNKIYCELEMKNQKKNI